MNIAIIDDQADIRYAVDKMLSKYGHTCYEFSGKEEDLVEGIEVFHIDLIILDMMLEEPLTGLDILARLKNTSYSIPTILMTGYATASNIINAAKFGIIDILEKPFGTAEILKLVEKYQTKDKKSQSFVLNDNNEEFIGSFETMENVFKKIGITAKSNISVLILGENGTGKSLVAKLIHQNSLKSDKPFIIIDCSTINEKNFETLFCGEYKNTGYIHAVEDGTLFLDNISDLTVSVQSKLFFFLERGFFIKGDKKVSFHGRILCSSSINLKELVEKNLFKSDFYHKIATLEIYLPNLNKRKKDIKELVYHFIKLANNELKTNVKEIDINGINFLENYTYRGNISELKNTIFRATLSARNNTIALADIQTILTPVTDYSEQEDLEAICKNIVNIYGVENSKDIFEDMEKGILKELTAKCNNISSLAKYMGISRNTLKAKIKKYRL